MTKEQERGLAIFFLCAWCLIYILVYGIINLAEETSAHVGEIICVDHTDGILTVRVDDQLYQCEQGSPTNFQVGAEVICHITNGVCRLESGGAS